MNERKIMPTGRLKPPELDDRTWEQIVEEMKDRIPQIAPEWTDHNPSDPGIAMIELFAHLSEMIIYRLNKVPEKNYIEFLNLLDITRDPPTPAKVELTFEFTDDSIKIPKGVQVSTTPTEQDEAIVFETDVEKTLSLNDNKIQATNALTIKQPEIIGYGANENFQVLYLKNAPLYADLTAPDEIKQYKHLKIFVDDVEWTRVSEFNHNEIQHYRCNPVTGEIIFGDGKLGGKPNDGAIIKAETYRYVANGACGNVTANSLIQLKIPIPGVSVINEKQAEGGTDWEDIEDTKRRAPKQIKSRYRAVTKEDYEFLAKEATNKVDKVRCLGPKKKQVVNGGYEYEEEPLKRIPGNVHVIIIPKVNFNSDIDDDKNRMPKPDIELLIDVETFLKPRCILTSELILKEPFYVEIEVETTVYVLQGEDTVEIAAEIKNDLRKFYHPCDGGLDGKGWDVGEDVYIPQVFEVINRHPKISYVKSLEVKKKDDSQTSTGVRIEIQEHELVCAANADKFKITVKEEKQEIS